MPLRLSRQLLLDQWNEAIAFVSSALDARLAAGTAHAGVHVCTQDERVRKPCYIDCTVHPGRGPMSKAPAGHAMPAGLAHLYWASDRSTGAVQVRRPSYAGLVEETLERTHVHDPCIVVVTLYNYAQGWWRRTWSRCG